MTAQAKSVIRLPVSHAFSWSGSERVTTWDKRKFSFGKDSDEFLLCHMKFYLHSRGK